MGEREHDRRRGAALVALHAQIRSAGPHHGARVGGAEGERVGKGGGERDRLPVDGQHGAAQAVERGQGVGVALGERRGGLVLLRERCGDDGGVAGAAAQVARQPHAHAGFVERAALFAQPGDGHHEARRAVAALAAVVVDERLLHRMKLTTFGEPFDRDDQGTVELPQVLDARVDGQERATGARDERCASAAVALGAHHLGARQPELVAQQIRERPAEGVAAHLMGAAVDRDKDVVPHGVVFRSVVGPRCAPRAVVLPRAAGEGNGRRACGRIGEARTLRTALRTTTGGGRWWTRSVSGGAGGWVRVVIA